MSGRRPKGKPRDRPEVPITARSLHKLFAELIIRGNLKMPGDAELEQLATVLEYWRLMFLNEEILLHRRELQEEAKAALSTLTDCIVKLAELDASNLSTATKESAPTFVLNYLSERISQSLDSRIRDFILGIGNHPALTHVSTGTGASKWMWLADVLPEDFQRAMKSANPHFAPRLGHTGPIARFIAGVAPLITGEHPTPSSVATQLKERRRYLNPASV